MTGKQIRLGVGIAFLGFALSTGTASALTGCDFSGCTPGNPGGGGSNPQLTSSTPTPTPQGEVLGEELSSPEAQPLTAEAPITPASAPAGQLPFTGGDIAGLVTVGVIAMGAGTLMVRRSRSGKLSIA